MDSRGLLRMAGQDQPVLVPADKGFTKAWLASLTARGAPTQYSGAALDIILMPIGGIGCGQVYLSGDGRLGHWDIFNTVGPENMGDIPNGLHYSKPLKPGSPFEMGFYVCEFNGEERTYSALDHSGFDQVEFTGQYPIGRVTYRKPSVEVELEAYSPFIPLNAEDSGLPVIVKTYKVTNPLDHAIEVEIAGWSESPCCLFSKRLREVSVNISGSLTGSMAQFAFYPGAAYAPESSEPDVMFEDFEKATYEGWTVEGTAFGSGPIEIAAMPKYQGDVKGRGKRVVNSHNTRQGEDVQRGDAHTGKLTSAEFRINHGYITMLVGGGNHPGQTCVNLLVDGKVVRTATGRDSNEMAPVIWRVRDLTGKMARIEIVDNVSGPWGNIGVDEIVFTDHPKLPALEDEPDYGDFAMGVVGSRGLLNNQIQSWSKEAPGFRTWSPERTGPAPNAVGKRLQLPPKGSAIVSFLVAWHFPNINRASLSFLQDSASLKRHYAKQFSTARQVIKYVADNFERLDGQTRLWTKTWYDSTLPYWFLDRTMANTSTLSTSTCYWFDNGRFYGWEGVYCCAGTCNHVWQYAHALARLFPQLERDTRERVDYGIAYHASGSLGHRAEAGQNPATDGQCGTILRVHREHQMSKDDAFLRRIWPKVKKSIEFMIAQDPNQDGLLEGAQFNTLDATWYGKIAWISGLYCAALRAGEAMAGEMGDKDFAALCGKIAEAGKKKLSSDLFNGEYFIQKVDPKFAKAINTNDGCHIDQVFGESWAWQVGLPRILLPDASKKSLKSLFRYNFSPDVGKYRSAMKAVKGGRWYALPGEPGLLMCTWPHGGAEKSPGANQADWAVGYFNECMTGFEHQAASHMIYEGLVTEGLAVERAIHDRYDGNKRNPYNEIECSDHYARAMASYGVFLAACGFGYHGPNGHLTFKPKIGADNFKAAFTTSEAWGTYSQNRVGNKLTCRIEVKWGWLQLTKLTLAGRLDPARVHVDWKPGKETGTIEYEHTISIGAGEFMELAVMLVT